MAYINNDTTPEPYNHFSLGILENNLLILEHHNQRNPGSEIREPLGLKESPIDNIAPAYLKCISLNTNPDQLFACLDKANGQATEIIGSLLSSDQDDQH